MSLKRLLLLVIVLAQMPLCLSAHHSTVAYARNSIVLKNATITKLVWADPHIILMFSAKEANGSTTSWSTESGSPVSVARVGWHRNSIKVGDVVAIELFPAKNGTRVGRLKKVIFSDGRELLDTQTNPQSLK